MSAVAAILNAYAGTPGFFAIIAEMEDPRRYPRSVFICQTAVTALYLTVGITVYYYCGSYVASPALGSAGLLMKRVCYGLALPGVVVSTFLFVHVSRQSSQVSKLPKIFLLTKSLIIASCKVHLHSNPYWHPAPIQEFPNTLVYLVKLHARRFNYRVYYSKRDSSI